MDRAPYAVEAAARTDNRARASLEVADPHLVADVARLRCSAFNGMRRRADVAPRGDADGGIREGTHEALQRTGGYYDSGIDVDDNFPARKRDGRVLEGRFAVALW